MFLCTNALHFPETLSKMSSSGNTTTTSSKDTRIVSLSEIPMFKGMNYLFWWPKMETYLISTSCMWIANITEPAKPTSSSTSEAITSYIKW